MRSGAEFFFSEFEDTCLRILPTLKHLDDTPFGPCSHNLVRLLDGHPGGTWERTSQPRCI